MSARVCRSAAAVSVSAAAAGTTRLRVRRKARTRAFQRVRSVFIVISFPAPDGAIMPEDRLYSKDRIHLPPGGRSSKIFDRLGKWEKVPPVRNSLEQFVQNVNRTNRSKLY